MLRRINLSAALIVFICFFLPWEQVSCGGAKDTLSGLDLARHDHLLLWLVPLAMLAVLVVGLLRRRGEKRQLFAVISLLSGGITALLMNGERGRVNDEAGIISAQLSGWFWLSWICSFVVVATAVSMLLKRRGTLSKPAEEL